MRLVLSALVFLVACDGGGKSPPDAKAIDAPATPMIDARSIDASTIDAPMPDAAVSMEIMTACMHVCDKLSITCAGGAAEPQCYSECGADLTDCTPQQVMDVDACSQLSCDNMGEAIGMCLDAIACVMG